MRSQLIPMLFATLVAAVSLRGQASPAPRAPLAFDVVSIKPNTSGEQGGTSRAQPGRYQGTNVTLKRVIGLAYRPVQEFAAPDSPPRPAPASERRCGFRLGNGALNGQGTTMARLAGEHSFVGRAPRRELSTRQSCLSATIGFTDVARRTGIRHASAAIDIRISATDTYVAGSVRVT
jgi:hypothetical protein